MALHPRVRNISAQPVLKYIFSTTTFENNKYRALQVVEYNGCVPGKDLGMAVVDPLPGHAHVLAVDALGAGRRADNLKFGHVFTFTHHNTSYHLKT